MFTHFPDLPSELRLKIWHHVPQPPRIIEIEQAHCDPRRRFYFTCTTPALLHACSESRSIALKTYQLAFGSPSPLTPPLSPTPPPPLLHPQPPVYVNFALDIFYLSGQEAGVLDTFVAFYAQARYGLERIRHLAVNSYLWDAHATYSLEQSDGRVMGVLEPFTVLEDLAVVVEPFCCWGEEACAHVGRDTVLSFVEPPVDGDADVMRGWPFLVPTVDGVREVVEAGLEEQEDWALEDEEGEVNWGKPVRILAALRV